MDPALVARQIGAPPRERTGDRLKADAAHEVLAVGRTEPDMVSRCVPCPDTRDPRQVARARRKVGMNLRVVDDLRVVDVVAQAQCRVKVAADIHQPAQRVAVQPVRRVLAGRGASTCLLYPSDAADDVTRIGCWVGPVRKKKKKKKRYKGK